MLAKRLFEADVSLNLIPEEGRELVLHSRRGDLFLSSRSFLLGNENAWYEIPINDIRDIRVSDPQEPKMEIILEGTTLTVRGAPSQHLMALRHFLLPFITSSEGS